jgi:hypothetical protein
MAIRLGLLVLTAAALVLWTVGSAAPAPIEASARPDREADFTLEPWPERAAIAGNLRARFRASPGVGTAVHYLRLADVLDAGDPAVADASLLLRGFDAQCAPLVATRNGVRYREHAHKIAATAQEESHVGQALAALAETGASVDLTILVDERERALSDVVADLVANHYPGRFDLEWTAIALAKLWPETTWTNRVGESSSFDELATQLMGRDAPRQSCGGVHVLAALAAILDRGRNGLSDAAATRIRTHLAASLATAASPARSPLHITWRDGVPTLARDAGPSLLVTGHLVELLLDSHVAGEAGPPVTKDAIRWLQQELQAFAAAEVTLQDMCAVSHAFRAVSLAHMRCVRSVSEQGRRR